MNRILKKSIICLFCMTIILVGTKVYATNTGKTINDTTRLRKEPNTTSETVELISMDTNVEILGEDGEWYKVKYESKTGYIRKDMLETSSNNEDTTQNITSNESETEKTEENVVNSNSETTAENTTENTTESNSNISETIDANNNTNTIQEGDSKITSTNVALRIVPSITSNIILNVTENTNYTVLEVMNKWSYISTSQGSGWVFTDKLKDDKIQSAVETTSNEENTTEENASNENTETKTEENTTTATDTVENTEKKAETVTKYVSTSTLNVREKAENDAKIITQLSLNEKVTVVETVDSSWCKISANGKTGYVASKYLSDKKSDISSRSENLDRTENEETEETTKKEENTSENNTSNTSSSSTKGTEIVSYAKQFLGCKYISGGQSPSGFDCSGFTSYVYNHFGISISRTSSAQASNGTAVSKSDLQMGDLIIFNNSSNSAIGHVGIYIGGNMFIHAATPSKGVITTSLSESYYSARYVCARRIIN